MYEDNNTLSIQSLGRRIVPKLSETLKLGILAIAQDAV